MSVMKNISETFVYVAKMPRVSSAKEIFPLERKQEIDACKNMIARIEKTSVWLLLTDVLKVVYDIDIRNLSIKKNNFGKWECDNLYFSLTHSKDLIGVAVSPKPIGIDVQIIKDAKMQSVISNENDDKDDTIIESFSKKEALFKKEGNCMFNPKNIATNEFKGICKIITSYDNDYVLTIASDEEINLQDWSK